LTFRDIFRDAWAAGGERHVHSWDLGKSKAILTMADGREVTVTRDGWVSENYPQYFTRSKFELESALEAQIIKGDDGRSYNRDHMVSYITTHEDFVLTKPCDSWYENVLWTLEQVIGTFLVGLLTWASGGFSERDIDRITKALKQTPKKG